MENETEIPALTFSANHLVQIPLLILVVLAMLKDRAPQLFDLARQTYCYIHDRLHARVVDEAVAAT